MRIPSYDDLTPSIPDISPADVFAAVATLLPEGGPIASRTVEYAAPARELYAALHGPASISPMVPEPSAAGPRTGPPRTVEHQRLERLAAIAADFSPRLERHPGGTVVLDIAGLQRLLGDAGSIAGHLAQAGVSNVAVATSQTAALILARAQCGISIATGDPELALRQVPLSVLQQLVEDNEAARPSARPARAGGRPPRTFDVLRRWGLTTLGELAALPAPELAARFGAGGVAIQRLARGIDPRPLVPDPAVRRFIESFELEWPIDTLEPLSFVFARMLEPLAAALERADRGGVALHLQLRLTDRTTHCRTLSLPAPMRDPRVLRTLLLLDLESHPPAAAVDVVAIEVDPVPGRVVQYSLLERPVPSPETLATLMARLGALVGEARCGSPVLLDTHRPDGWAMALPAFGDRVNSPLPTANSQVCLPLSNRSFRELGIGSGTLAPGPGKVPATVLRRFRPPVAVRVAVEAGRPARVAVDRRGMPGGEVRQAAGPWRTSGGWWTERWNRDEWDVALDDGAVCRMFQDRDTNGWFLEGVYD